MGRQGRPGLWAVAVSSMVLHFILGLHLLRTHEFISFEPICYYDPTVWSLGSALHTIEGDLAWDFYYAVQTTLHQNGFNTRARTDGRTLVYVTPVDWWDDEMMWNVTTKAVWRILEERQGITRSDVTEGRIRVKGFESDGLPTCEALRAIAIRGGKWEREGPEVTPISH